MGVSRPTASERAAASARPAERSCAARLAEEGKPFLLAALDLLGGVGPWHSGPLPTLTACKAINVRDMFLHETSYGFLSDQSVYIVSHAPRKYDTFTMRQRYFNSLDAPQRSDTYRGPRGRQRRTINTRTQSGFELPVLKASRLDDAAELRRLLRNGARPDVKEYLEEKQGIHLAAEHNSVRALKALLEAGVDPNAKAAFGCTPLHACCIHDSVQALEVLLRCGANPLITDFRGRNVIDHAEHLRANRCLYALTSHGLVRRKQKSSRTLRTSGNVGRRSRLSRPASAQPFRGWGTTKNWQRCDQVDRAVYQAHLNGAPLSNSDRAGWLRCAHFR